MLLARKIVNMKNVYEERSSHIVILKEDVLIKARDHALKWMFSRNEL